MIYLGIVSSLAWLAFLAAAVWSGLLLKSGKLKEPSDALVFALVFGVSLTGTIMGGIGFVQFLVGR